MELRQKQMNKFIADLIANGETSMIETINKKYDILTGTGTT
jgi:hypothetical protein